ncbi:MAG: LysR family transcriptional regulator [Pseudomonadota bacterium]|nr:LysR family transcriptional regulator [Pseudomonadota bacterium]
MTDPAAHPRPLRLKQAQLRLVAAIDAHRQLGLAAEALAMTQPAAARMWREIAAGVGARLFERHARGMHPTLIGRALARRARGLAQEMRDLAAEVDQLRAGRGGLVRVGAVTGASVGYLVPAIRQLKAAAPEVEVYVDVEPSDVLARGLAAGTYDFALGRIPVGMDPQEFDALPARPEAVDLVVRADHPMASARRLELAELTPYDWVMQSPGAPIRTAVETAFLAAGARLPRSIINTPSLLVMIALLSSSTAIAAMAREVNLLLSGPEVGARLTRLAVREEIVVAPYHMLTARRRRLSPAAERLRALVLHELGAPRRG